MRFPIFVLFAGLAFAGPGEAGADDPSMDQYVTCAVYYRMLVGSFSSRYGRGLDAMADINREKMDKAIKLGKAAAVHEHGQALADEKFNAAWADVLAVMTDEINRNYDNISRIKYKYRNGCEKLIGPE